MKFDRNLIYRLIHKHLFGVGIFTSLFLFFFFAGGLVVANGQTLGPTDSHVVDLYVDGVNSTVPSRAATVGQFLNQNHVTVYQDDLVEPALNTPIATDSFSIQIFRAKPVTIVDGGNTQHILSPYSGAKLIAEKAGYTIYPEDKLSLVTDSNFVQDNIIGAKLTIDPATPVSVSLYGAPAVIYRTQAKTVGDFLKSAKIILTTGATVTPSANTPLVAGMPIYVSKFGVAIVTSEAPVNFTISSTNDPTQTYGKINIITPGVNGEQQIVYQVELKNGVEIGRKIIQDIITTPPQTQIQTIGTKILGIIGDKETWMTEAGISPSDFASVNFIISHESNWRPDATNGAGCIGLGQDCPQLGDYWLADNCPDWQTDPVCQLKSFSTYAKHRYGSWSAAAAAWSNNGSW